MKVVYRVVVWHLESFKFTCHLVTVFFRVLHFAVTRYSFHEQSSNLTRTSAFLNKYKNWKLQYVFGKRLGMLGRIRSNITDSCAETVYKSFILPILDYCDTAWACCGQVNLSLLERRAAKIVLNCNNSEAVWSGLGLCSLATINIFLLLLRNVLKVL